MENFKYLVFSFGSNSIKQLRGRLKNKNLKGRQAILSGHIRIYGGCAKTWNQSGVASLYKTNNESDKVYGSVVELS